MLREPLWDGHVREWVDAAVVDGTAAASLLDKQEITEVLTRYMRAVDRGDLDTLRACYLPARPRSTAGSTAAPESYVDGIGRTLTHPRALTTHCCRNVLIELDGDRAPAECYVTAFARVSATPISALSVGDALLGAHLGSPTARHRKPPHSDCHQMCTLGRRPLRR